MNNTPFQTDHLSGQFYYLSLLCCFQRPDKNWTLYRYATYLHLHVI